MIPLHRVNGAPLYVAAPHILSVEPGVDTRIHLTTGAIVMVSEDAGEVMDAIVGWFATVAGGAGAVGAAAAMATGAVRHALQEEIA